MPVVDTVIVGGSQAGLAMSRSLSERSIDHIVLERGRIGERWRSERWDSLRLLTPRWLSTIGGWAPDAADPNSFMHRLELIKYLEQYARTFSAPVAEETSVIEATSHGDRFTVTSTAGVWSCQNLVIATGHNQRARVPRFAWGLDSGVFQLVPTQYRSPESLPRGGVLVVGASATGLQLADEIHASGRAVTLATGRHTRLPRRYRGRDIMEWLDRMGVMGQRISEVGNPAASRAQPSLQLVGSTSHRTLDLGVLADRGVRLCGRAVDAKGQRVRFDDSLIENIAAADFKLAALRERIDRFVTQQGLDSLCDAPDDFVPSPLPDAPCSIDLRRDGIRTVLWATGFRRSYPWLQVPVLDGKGELIHDGGVTPVPGLYCLGLNFQQRRSSSFIAGVAADAEELATHMVANRAVRTAHWAVA